MSRHHPGVRREGRWETATGEELDVVWSVTPLPEDEGMDRYLLAAEDVTQQARQREELAASRARIVHAADDARRRLERNLHDGAQQRLVSLSLALRLAQTRVTSDPDGADAVLQAAREELALALEELRELARGIHPGGADRARARAGARVARLAVAAAGRRRGARRTAPGAGGGSGVLRRLGGAHERVEVRARDRGGRASRPVGRPRRGRGAGRRRRRSGGRLGLRSPRPGRPRLGAERDADGRQPARRGHRRPRRHSAVRREGE